MIVSMYLPERLSTPTVAVHPQSDMLRLFGVISWSGRAGSWIDAFVEVGRERREGITIGR